MLQSSQQRSFSSRRPQESPHFDSLLAPKQAAAAETFRNTSWVDHETFSSAKRNNLVTRKERQIVLGKVFAELGHTCSSFSASKFLVASLVVTWASTPTLCLLPNLTCMMAEPLSYASQSEHSILKSTTQWERVVFVYWDKARVYTTQNHKWPGNWPPAKQKGRPKLEWERALASGYVTSTNLWRAKSRANVSSLPQNCLSQLRKIEIDHFPRNVSGNVVSNYSENWT